MPAISPVREANMATRAWTKLYTGIMSYISGVYEYHLCMALPEATPGTVHTFAPPVSGLPSLVEAKISVMCASTSAVFASRPRSAH